MLALEQSSPAIREPAMNDTVKYVLDESRIPKAWYNIMADLPVPPPAVLHPGTLQPVGPDDLAPLFPMELIQQEVTQERDVEIPEPVRDVYRQWRPCPLYRARRLEKALQTPARIYYKYAIDEAIRCREEGVSRAILFNLCGHGHFDMQAYIDYFAGKLEDRDYDERELAMALSGLPSVPEPA